MAVTIGNKVYVDGLFVGNVDEAICPISEGVVIEVDYEKPIVYVIDQEVQRMIHCISLDDIYSSYDEYLETINNDR